MPGGGQQGNAGLHPHNGRRNRRGVHGRFEDPVTVRLIVINICAADLALDLTKIAFKGPPPRKYVRVLLRGYGA
jgi:hypothetical protein